MVGLNLKMLVLFQCLTDYSSVQAGIKWLMAALCEWWWEGKQCLSSLSPARWPSKAPSNPTCLKCTPQDFHNRFVFCWSSFGRQFISSERKGHLHSALSSGTITAHLIPNWSCRDEIRHGECSWTLTVTTAVDVSISALYLVCLMRVLTCTAKKEISPPTHTHILTVPWMPTFLDFSVFVMHP